jgi:hypothetical protein
MAGMSVKLFDDQTPTHMENAANRSYSNLEGFRITEEAKQKATTSFTESFDLIYQEGIWNSLAAGTHFPGRLEVASSQYIFRASIPLDKPGIYQSQGFTVRVYDTDLPRPSLRITSITKLFTPDHRMPRFYFLQDEPRQGGSPRGNCRQYFGLGNFIQDYSEMGRDLGRFLDETTPPPLPPGKLLIFCYEYSEPEQYELDLPVVAEPSP